jgi:hypothetical protein
MYQKGAAKSWIEVQIDSNSPFWRLNEPVDPNGDPLELLIRREEGDEEATLLLTYERTKPRMNLLTNLQQLTEAGELSREGVILAIRSISNWANGNLMTISNIRLKNFAKTGDPDQSSQDDQAGEPGDEHAQNERSSENGGQHQLTLTQRGDCFASIRETCFKLADAMNLQGFDRPRGLGDYLEARATGLRKSEPSKADIQAEVEASLGITEEEARAFLLSSYKEQAAEIEKNKDDLVAEDSTYETDIDFEEAMHTLGIVAQHRVQVKIIGDVIRETQRIQKIREKYPNFEDLRTKRHLLLWDVITLDDQFRTFEKAHKAALDKELAGTNRVLSSLPRNLQMTLDLVRRQVANKTKAA